MMPLTFPADSNHVDQVIAASPKHWRVDAVRVPIWIVPHTGEVFESNRAALSVAGAFASGPRAASSHYVIGPDITIQCVREAHVAYAAGQRGNLYGIHVELVGFASQKLVDWHDDASTKILERFVKLAADIARRNQILPTKLEVSDVAALASGLCGHDEIAKAFKQTDHYDPGPAFPWNEVIPAVRAILS